RSSPARSALAAGRSRAPMSRTSWSAAATRSSPTASTAEPGRRPRNAGGGSKGPESANGIRPAPGACAVNWADMLKIDTHAHILPPTWPDLAAKYGDDRFPVMVQADGRHRIYKDGKFFREVWANAFDPEVRIADYAKFGVDVQVVSTVPVLFSYWAKPSQALELHRHLNDQMAEVCRRYPRHYAGIGTVPLQSPTLAIQEMERCIDQLGLQGVQIGSHCEAWNLDAPELFPFFEAAAELGAAILVHPWDMMGASTMPKYWLPWLVGMPAEQARAACCLIFGGVLERLPRLKVCFAHGGGSFPYTIGRIEHGFRMRPDLVAT